MSVIIAGVRYLSARFVRTEEGASAVEYGLLVGLIAVAIIVTVGLLGGALDGLFQSVTDQLPGDESGT